VRDRVKQISTYRLLYTYISTIKCLMGDVDADNAATRNGNNRSSICVGFRIFFVQIQNLKKKSFLFFFYSFFF